MAKHGKLQSSVEYLSAKTIFAALRLVPLTAAMRMGQALGAIAYFSAGDLRRTGQRNLALALSEKNEIERTLILRACFASLGRTLGLFSHFATASPESIRSLVDARGLEHLDSARKEGRGVILFTGHLGAWELTSFALSVLGRPLSFLVRRIDNPAVERLIDQSRVRFGNQTLDKLSAARSMVKILRSGEVLGLLLDLNTLDDEAIFVDFFGVPASTNFMVAKLALRTQSPIIPIFAPWDKAQKKFVLQIEPPISMERTGNEELDVRRLTEKLSLIIEDVIKRYPDQWLWIHKRWKTRPKGEPDLYS
jgi:Kdo2-lipid IVA lauroyltransferase/acyltransferase